MHTQLMCSCAQAREFEYSVIRMQGSVADQRPADRLVVRERYE
jgi:hypothetical protein